MAGERAGRAPSWLAPALACLVFALLAAAFWWVRLAAPEQTDRPALWRISMGDRHAYLFGTIHAVPAGARWLSPRIADAARESDWLVLEVTGLDSERRDRSVFQSLGQHPGLRPVAARLDPADRARLADLARRAPDALAGIDGYEDWAAALLVSTAASSDLSLSNAQAGEARFERIFAGGARPIVGLETVREQLGLFDRLSPADQHALLVQSVREAADAPKLYAALYRSWAGGDLAGLDRQFLAPLATSPGLRAVLLDTRNARWARKIDHLLRHERKTLFVAVGAGHLLGPGGLQARLAAMGWEVERQQ